MREEGGTQRPQCILCCRVLANANLKPSRLNKNFNNQHRVVKTGNDFNTLKIKRALFYKSGTLPKYGFSRAEKLLLHASYQVAFLLQKK